MESAFTMLLRAVAARGAYSAPVPSVPENPATEDVRCYGWVEARRRPGTVPPEKGQNLTEIQGLQKPPTKERARSTTSHASQVHTMTKAGFQGDLSEQMLAVLKEPKIHIRVKSGSFNAGVVPFNPVEHGQQMFQLFTFTLASPSLEANT
ncbi:hypothetical protein BTVI_126174 [Pitangus sulphuratus]|nr:hypothetical protein BTVI_126174 [Pitangus sulphuratus]